MFVKKAKIKDLEERISYLESHMVSHLKIKLDALEEADEMEIVENLKHSIYSSLFAPFPRVRISKVVSMILRHLHLSLHKKPEGVELRPWRETITLLPECDNSKIFPPKEWWDIDKRLDAVEREGSYNKFDEWNW